MNIRRMAAHVAMTGGTAIAIGLVFSSIYAIGKPEYAPQILATGAIIGVCIAIVIAILEWFFNAAIERLASPWRIIAKSLVFITGGTGGWVGGMFLCDWLLGIGMRPRELLRGPGPLMLTLVAAIALIVGLAFYAHELLKRRLERTIEELKQREWAEKELVFARSIQTRLLPPTLIESDGYTIAARNLPARFVAGDFYDVVRLDDGSLVIVVADVAGKGVGASLIMASVKAVLPFVAREPARNAMAMLNTKLVQELGRREFVALAYARLQQDGTLEVLNAGFPEPYVVARDGVRTIATQGERLPLGLKPDVAYEPSMTRLASGERLVFVSDGIPEAPAQGEPLGYERVAALLAQTNDARGSLAWLDVFLDRVRAHVDDGLADDWTAVVVERRR